MTKEELKNYYHLLTVPFILFTIWLWSFPMYGPLLASTGVNTGDLFLFFLISHALGALSYGLIMDFLYKKNFGYKKELITIISFSFITGFLTVIFPYISALYHNIVIAFIGILSGPLVVFFLYYLSLSVKGILRGRIVGLIFSMAGFLQLIFLLLPYNNWMFIVNGFLLISPILFLKNFLKVESQLLEGVKSSVILPETGKYYWISLLGLVFMFYFGSGLMYNLIYAEIMYIEISSFDIGFLFYPLIVLPAGYMADRRGRKNLINLGLCFSGLGFLLLLLFEVFYTLPLILLQSSFAVMDLFVLLTIIDWASYFRSRKFVAAGLFINVITIFLSSLPFMGNRVAELIPGRYWPVIGLILVLLIVPLLNLIKETSFRRLIKDPPGYRSVGFDVLCDKYSITPREKEIINLLLEGKDTETITGKLCITYNTLKTHLRNIYRKTETGSQKELILFIMERTK